MSRNIERFLCAPEPGGTWQVQDKARQSVASLGGVPLSGLPEQQARTLCNVLARIHRDPLSARALRGGGRRGGATAQLGAMNRRRID